jgi:hypothetical protein
MDDFVTVDLFDRPRRLRYDANAVADYEEDQKELLVDTFFMDPNKRMGIGIVRAALWAGFKGEDKRLTKERVGMMIENYLNGGGQIPTLLEHIYDALTRSRLFSVTKSNDPNAQSPGNSPNGSGSSSSSSTAPTTSPAEKLAS